MLYFLKREGGAGDRAALPEMRGALLREVLRKVWPVQNACGLPTFHLTACTNRLEASLASYMIGMAFRT